MRGLSIPVKLSVAAQARRVFSSDGKNASNRSSCAVTSIGVPIVDTTEKKLSGAPSNSKHTSMTGADTGEALDAHYRSEAFADFQLGLDGLLARPSESTVYSAEASVRPLNTRPINPRDAD